LGWSETVQFKFVNSPQTTFRLSPVRHGAPRFDINFFKNEEILDSFVAGFIFTWIFQVDQILQKVAFYTHVYTNE